MQTHPIEWLLLALAVVMFCATVLVKPTKTWFRVDPRFARASNAVLWGYMVVWTTSIMLGSGPQVQRGMPGVIVACFAILFWGWFRSRAV